MIVVVTRLPACYGMDCVFHSTFSLDSVSQPSLNRSPRNLHTNLVLDQDYFRKNCPIPKNDGQNLKFRRAPSVGSTFCCCMNLAVWVNKINEWNNTWHNGGHERL